MNYFANVNDQTQEQGKWHLLSDILALTICGVEWIRNHGGGNNIIVQIR